MVYKLNIESGSEDVVKDIQQWVSANYNSLEIFWNAITVEK